MIEAIGINEMKEKKEQNEKSICSEESRVVEKNTTRASTVMSIRRYNLSRFSAD